MPIDFKPKTEVFKTRKEATEFAERHYAPSPVVINPFDIEQAKSELSRYEEKIKGMLTEAQAFEITDEASNSKAVEMGLQAKKLSKRVKEDGADRTKKHRLYTGAVKNLVRVYTDMLDSIESDLKGKFREYSRIKEMKRREDDLKVKEAARALQDRVNREAKKKNIDPILIPEPVLPQKQAPTRTEEGSGSMKKVWTWDKNEEEIDFDKVPDEYKILNGPAINTAIKAAVRNIPGIRIYQDDVPVWRG